VQVLLIFLLVSASVGLGFLAFVKPRAQKQVERRLKRTRGRPTPASVPVPEPLARGMLPRLFAALEPYLEGRFAEEREAQIQRRLHMAGDHTTAVGTLLAQKSLAVIALPLGWLVGGGWILELSLPVVAAGTCAAAFVGWILPDERLQVLIQRRQAAIVRVLPTTLDLLTTCVEAGLSLQAAMAKVVEIGKPNPLREELERTLREIQLGRSRAEALRELGRRTGLTELNAVAIAMVQAETMGASIARTLRVQSEILRETRWQKAQERAQAATLKLTFPVVFLIFPTLFIIIFGPLLLSLVLGR
jgi:tight adherence protein C